MGNIFVIGTSHIAKESIEKISAFIEKNDPDIIAVELDEQRLYALMHHQKPDFSLRTLSAIGLSSYIFLLIGYNVQKKLGKLVGLNPGADMLYAAKQALSRNKMLILIDRDIRITLKRFSKKFSFKEKLRIISDLFSGVVLKKKIKFDLTKVPADDLVEKIISIAEERYPGLYQVLISERNAYMAKRLIETHQRYPEAKILAVVGAGHKAGILEILRNVLQ